MKKILFMGAVAMLLSACNYQAPVTQVVPTETPMVTASPTPTQTQVTVPAKMTIAMAEENKSGQKGTAVIESTTGGVKVTINLTGSKMAAAQPAHIHVGMCPGVGAVKYPLTSVVNGKSVTMLAVSMADLVAAEPLAVNVHKSAAEISVYTACGELK